MAGPRSRRGEPAEPLPEALEDHIDALPEPLHAFGDWALSLHEDRDVTGARKRLYELGAAVVRYGVGVGLAATAAAFPGQAAPARLAERLRGAARLTDGRWAELLRELSRCLRGHDDAVAALLAFSDAKGKQNRVNALIEARNHFVHGTSPGDDAVDRYLALAEAAALLLSAPLHFVRPEADTDALEHEARMGRPGRRGRYRLSDDDAPADVVTGAAYLRLGDAKGRWLRVDPYLPLLDERIVLPEVPLSSKKPWRSWDPVDGTIDPCPALTDAVAHLAGKDPNAPQPLSARPALVPVLELRDRLFGALDVPLTDHGRGVAVVALVGAQGTGKTRWLEELGPAAGSLGYKAVLRLTCSRRRRAPFGPLSRALREEDGVELPRLQAAIAAAQQAGLVSSPDAFEGAVESIEEALLEESLRSGATHGPLLLTLDDLQWADEGTLTLVDLLLESARGGARGRLLLAVACRAGDLPERVRSWLGAVAGCANVTVGRHDLGPLDADAARQVLAGVGPMEASLVGGVVERAAGRPYYLIQPPVFLWECGTLRWEGGQWAAPREGLPTSDAALAPVLDDLVGSALPPDTREAGERLLAVLAHASDDLHWRAARALGEAHGTDAAATEGVLAALLEACVLSLQQGRYRFELPIVEAAARHLYGTRPWFRDVFAGYLVREEAARGPTAGEWLASGWLILGEKDRAAGLLLAAMDEALRLGAFLEASRLADLVVEHAREPSTRHRGLLGAVRADLRGGAGSSLAARWERLRDEPALEPADDVARRLLEAELAVIVGRGRADELGARVPDDTLPASIDALGSATPEHRAEARRLAAATLRGDAGVALVDDGLTHLGAASGPDAIVVRYELLALRLNLLMELQRRDAWRPAVDALATAAEATGSTYVRLELENERAVVAAYTGDLVGARLAFDRVIQGARAAHLGSLARTALNNAAMCLMSAGHLDEALARASECRALADASGLWRQRAIAASTEGQVLLRLGRATEALAAFEATLELKQCNGDKTVGLTLLFALHAAHATGDRSRTRQLAMDVVAATADAGPRDRDEARLWRAIVDESSADDLAAAQVTFQAGGYGDRLARDVVTIAEEEMTRRAGSR